MRQTGRTTRMLLKLATYISENWDEEQRIVVVAHNEIFADALQSKLLKILGVPGKHQSRLVQYGKTITAFMGRDRANHPSRRVYRDEVYFYDHYQGVNYEG